jgi:hypothetical protein
MPSYVDHVVVDDGPPMAQGQLNNDGGLDQAGQADQGMFASET